MRRRRILVADDHEIVRVGVCALLHRHADWEICGEAVTGREAVEMAVNLKPDVIIMDLAMPELDGLAATRQIKRLVPEAEVIIFTANETDEIVRRVFESGARAYLLKVDASKHLIPAIEMLARGRTYFSSKVSEMIFSAYLESSSA